MSRLHLQPGARLPLDAPDGPTSCTVERFLVDGSKASLYLATDAEGGPLALKTTRRKGPGAADLVIEQRILKQLSHPDLLRYRGRHVSEELLVLATERLFTNPLLVLNRPAIRRHFPNDVGNHYLPLPPSVALALSVDLMRALEYMHRNGYVHHDVKLGNLLVRAAAPALELEDADLLDQVIAGRCKGVLVDLGGTRSLSYLEDLAAGRVDPKIVPPQLTPIYAPPESMHPDRARRRHHPSLDVYAAAIVIYTAISGRRAYDHLQLDVSDLEQVIAAKRDEALGKLLPSSFEALSGVPGLQAIAADLNGFLSACLDRRPESRPTPAQARKYLEGLHRLLTKGGRRAPPSAGRDADARDPNVLFGTTPAERRRNRDQARGRLDR